VAELARFGASHDVVQRSLLGNQISERLRRDILFGVIKPGTRLSQRQLCEQFGTSRMPVRDALRTLMHEGLLFIDPGQHTVVAPLSRSDLLDAYVIEGTLAGLAAQRASQNASADDLDRLAGFHKRMLDAEASGDHAAMAELNWTLHRDINRIARSRKLLVALKVVSLELPRDFLMKLPERVKRSNDDHEAILQAMRKRRHVQAGHLMTEHIVDSGRGLIDYLESEGLEFD
jgi:DNA-binding GntR family transcriptional regulator